MPYAQKKRVKETTINQQVLVKRFNKNAQIPTQQNEGDAGFDISVSRKVIIKPGKTRTIPTGLGFKIPPNFVGILKVRSSMGRKGLGVSGGVIDSNYVGEVKLILHNRKTMGKICIKKQERVAQILFIPLPKMSLVEVDELPQTERGSKGFGSTGKFENGGAKHKRQTRSKRTKRISG